MDPLARFRGCPVLVVGDLMLDEFVWGHVSRISPEAPVPVVDVKNHTYVAGGAANTAANVAALAGRPAIAGILGDDSAGDRVCGILEANGVNTDATLRSAERPTTTKTRIVAHSQQMVRIDHEAPGAIDAGTVAELLERIDSVLPRMRACVISDYGKGVVTPELAQGLIARCREQGVPVVVDPKGTDYRKYGGATLVKPNQHEAAKVLNRELNEPGSVLQAGRDLMDVLGPDTALLITQGAHGMSLFERGRNTISIPATAREVYDVTGAGDTVAGTIALALGANANLESACRLAATAAGIVVGKVGTATVSLEELMTATGVPMRHAA